MTNPLFQATEAAIEELLEKHLQANKYGYLLSQDSKRELAQDLVEFFMLSRRLKAAGDKLIQSQSYMPGRKSQTTLR